MATKIEHLHLELAHFNNFKHHIAGSSTWCTKTINKLMMQGLLQVSTAFEQALAKVGNKSVVSKDAHDLSDGSDAKLITVRTTSGGKKYAAALSGFKNKTGVLRVQCYERLQNKFYYFVIPYWAYCNVPGTSTIEIPFEIDGSPRRKSMGKKKWSNWWDFEVPDFTSLALDSGKVKHIKRLHVYKIQPDIFDIRTQASVNLKIMPFKSDPLEYQIHKL